MISENHIILSNAQINQKIKRIAYQIYESNSEEKEVVIAGIVGNGYAFSKKIAKVLTNIYFKSYALRSCNRQEKPLITHYYLFICCLLYTSPSPRDLARSRMPSSA